MSSIVILVAWFTGLGFLQSPTLPNHRLTPGAIVTTDRALICSPGYARRTRSPYNAEWRRLRVRMFRKYGIPHDQWHRYVTDHAIPLEAGGAPLALANLQPELLAESKEKDEVENRAHEEICDGSISVQQAQHAFATDWRTLP